jgi:hypothetical protein
MIGERPEVERLLYPVSEVAAKCGASAAQETENPDEAYADWPGEFRPGAPLPARRVAPRPVAATVIEH